MGAGENITFSLSNVNSSRQKKISRTEEDQLRPNIFYKKYGTKYSIWGLHHHQHNILNIEI